MSITEKIANLRSFDPQMNILVSTKRNRLSKVWILMLGCKRLKTEINITDKVYILSYIIEKSLNSDLIL